MTVVVQKDSGSSESVMNLDYLLPEDLLKMLNTFHLQFGHDVPHLTAGSSYQELQEVSPMSSGSDWGGTFYLADPIEGEPVSDTWPIPMGTRVWKTLVSADAQQQSGLDPLGMFSSQRESDSYGSAQKTIAPSFLRKLIRVAVGEDAIVVALRLYGLDVMADRLNHLIALIAEDPDEPDLVIESLRSFADFFMQEDRLPVPEIGAGPEGFLEAEWRIPAKREVMTTSHVVRWASPDDRYWGQGDGILAMKFLPSGSIQYAAVSGPAGQGKERLRSSDILSKDSIMPTIQAFTSRLALP